MGWNGMSKTKGRPSEASVKVFAQAFFKKLAGCGTASHGLALMARSAGKKARETAKRFSRTAAQLPSQSRLPPCQRLGCRLGRPLGNVPPGRSGPKGGAE